MKNIVYVPSKNTDESVAFYVDELRLLELSEDLGMGSILLRYVRSSDFYLMLSPEVVGNASGMPIFSIGVEDCDKEFLRLKDISFRNGAGIIEPFGVIEYPLGKFFKLRDPAGNVLSLYEWYI
ncbi:hypothetical protein [Ralstonia solanacearum]|uniref:VOC domain-containing protein n=1 Tax=Ralstonia solanacearum TaxID=305 RepID=A0AAE3NIU9_RALSL|nr:hypothetical protein [Ralstonia solanacearum]MBB6583789.1 hypothetical protein [Ralstonia solanacearum]MDB0521779.1 hypothetical protein [Ralstonia solanacearum]